MERILHHCIGVGIVHSMQDSLCQHLRQGRQKHEFRSCCTSGRVYDTLDLGIPVAVNNIVILKVSASITCAPELGPTGDSRLVIA